MSVSTELIRRRENDQRRERKRLESWMFTGFHGIVRTEDLRCVNANEMSVEPIEMTMETSIYHRCASQPKLISFAHTHSDQFYKAKEQPVTRPFNTAELHLHIE